MNQPLVSVIIPTYNRKAYVQEAIDSVLAQTYPYYEIIVIDDGSTDGTGEALESRYGDRIIYHWQENRGESAARNWGTQLANGDHIAFLDSDDLWLPQKLERQINWLAENKETGLLTCFMELIDGDGQLLPLPLNGTRAVQFDKTFEVIYQDNILGAATSAAIVSKRVLAQVGGFDQLIRFGEDWDLWIRIAAISRYQCLPEVLVKLRIHQGGQWFFPKPEKITNVLNDHIRILEKGYQIWPNRPEQAAEIRDKKMAGEYGIAAIHYYAYQQEELGTHALTRAISLDSVTWTNLSIIKLRILELVYGVEEIQGPGHGIALVSTIIQELAKSKLLRIEPLDKTISQYFVELGYYYSAEGKKSRAILYFLAAMRKNYHYLFDKGVQIEFIRNVFGGSTAI